MRVKRKQPIKSLTINHIYTVIKETEKEYRILNDLGNFRNYAKRKFEVIKDEKINIR